MEYKEVPHRGGYKLYYGRSFYFITLPTTLQQNYGVKCSAIAASLLLMPLYKCCTNKCAVVGGWGRVQKSVARGAV